MADLALVQDIRTHGPKEAVAAWRVRHPEARGPDLSAADVIGLDFSECNLRYANLADARFFHATLSDADLRGATLRRARFDGAVMRRADLDMANAAGANFNGADLSHAKFRCANGELCSFHAANLASALLMWSDFQGAQFERASLEGADFRCAKLFGTTFKHARFSKNVDLRSTHFEKGWLAAQLLTAEGVAGTLTTRQDLARAVAGLKHRASRGKIPGTRGPKEATVRRRHR